VPEPGSREAWRGSLRKASTDTMMKVAEAIKPTQRRLRAGLCDAFRVARRIRAGQPRPEIGFGCACRR